MHATQLSIKPADTPCLAYRLYLMAINKPQAACFHIALQDTASIHPYRLVDNIPAFNTFLCFKDKKSLLITALVLIKSDSAGFFVQIYSQNREVNISHPTGES